MTPGFHYVAATAAAMEGWGRKLWAAAFQGFSLSCSPRLPDHCLPQQAGKCKLRPMITNVQEIEPLIRFAGEAIDVKRCLSPLGLLSWNRGCVSCLKAVRFLHSCCLNFKSGSTLNPSWGGKGESWGVFLCVGWEGRTGWFHCHIDLWHPWPVGTREGWPNCR